MGRVAASTVVMAVAGLVGCGGDDGRAGRTAPDPAPGRAATAALGLTSRLPAPYRAACERLRLRLDTDACPPVIPRGRLKIELERPLGRSPAYRATFNIDLLSPSLGRLGRRRTDAAGGHWTIAAVRGARGARVLSAWLRAAGARRGSRCAERELAGESVEVCLVPSYEEGGGYYGGHVAYSWRRGALIIQLTAHGYGNEPRVEAMMSAVIASSPVR